MDDLRSALLQLILDKPGIKSDDIFEVPMLRDEEKKRISNFLFIIKKDGQAVADESRHYSITAKGRAFLNGDKSKAPATPKSKQRSTPPPKSGTRLRGHREDSDRGRRARPGRARPLPDHRRRPGHHRPLALGARLGA